MRRGNDWPNWLETSGHAVALHLMHDNFVRRHASLRMSPAMAAGVSGTLLAIEDIVGIID